ncbi:chorismate synthase [Tepidiforma flava]|uniref:chorismate synthase n=1 Tax=Tepidiforma flava TaxID=3004094 RepID=A0ABY7M714_9CHLR|nr:chorismate synthase [Tepidiforma flava]WBL36322.1 chorismate synthase [Tepidiforma flava]
MGHFRFLTAGESHGKGLTMVIEGLPAGLPSPKPTSPPTSPAGRAATAAAAA